VIDFVEDSIDFQEEVDFQALPESTGPEPYLSTDDPPGDALARRSLQSQPPARTPEELAARNFLAEQRAIGALPARTSSAAALPQTIEDPLDPGVSNPISAQVLANAIDSLKLIGLEMNPDATVFDVEAEIEKLGGPDRKPTSTEKTVAGAQSAVAGTVKSFTSPLGLATLGVGVLPRTVQRVAAAAFAGHMLSGMPEQAMAASEAIERGDTEAASRHITEFALSGTFTGLAAKHAMTPAPKPPVVTPELVEPKPRVQPSRGPQDGVVIDIGNGHEIVVRPTPGLEPPRIRELEAPKVELPPAPEPRLLEDKQSVGTVEAPDPTQTTPRPSKPLELVDAPVKNGTPGLRGVGDFEVVAEDHPVSVYSQTPEAMATAREVASRYSKALQTTPQELAVDGVTHLFLEASKHTGAPVDRWARTTLDNYYKDRLRGRDVVRDAERFESDQPPTVAVESTPAREVAGSEIMKAYETARGALSQSERAILDVLEGDSGVSLSDLARVQGVSRSAITQRVPGIRKKLAAEMSKAGVDPADFLTIKNGLDSPAPGIRIKTGTNRQRQGGFINPAILSAVANVLRPMVNAGVRVATATRNMVRLFGSRVLPYVRRAWASLVKGGSTDPYNPKGLERVLRKWFSARRLKPPEVDRLSTRMRGQISMWNEGVLNTIRDIERAGKLDDPTLQAIDRVMRGQAPASTLPPRFQAPVQTARAQIDHLSGELINSGIVHGNLVNEFLRQMGQYLSRSYQIHTASNWAKKVPLARRLAAEAHVRAQLQAAGRNPTDAEVTGVINELLNNQDSGNLFRASGAVEGSKDLGILKKRKALPQVIRELYGEVTDPIANFAITAGKQARLLEHHRFLEAVKSEGLGKFLFDEPVGDYAKRISAEGNPSLAPLDGLYTTPDIYDAMQLGAGDPNPGLAKRLYYWGNSVTQWNQTVGSVKSQLRNTYANPLISLGNGNFMLWKILPAMKLSMPDRVRASLGDLGWMDNTVARREILRMHELNLLGDAAIGELTDRVRRTGARVTNSPSEDFLKETVGRKALLSPVRFLNWAWRTGDNIFRIYDWKNEVAKMRWAEPNRPLAEIEVEAAEIVRNQRPTYERVPEAIQSLRVLPVGMFFSFPSEIVRNSANTFTRSLKEMGDSNPRKKAIGVTRAIGLLTAVSAASAFAAWTADRLGITSDREDAARRFLPDFSKNSDLFFYRGDDGKIGYVDASFMDPYKVLKEPLMAAMQGEDTSDKIAGSIGAVLKPYVQETIMAGLLVDLSRNRTPEGREIWNEADTQAGKWEKAFKYSLQRGLAPGAMKDTYRFYLAETGQADTTISARGRMFDKTAERLSLSGARARTLDIETGLEYKARDFKRDIVNAEKLFEDVLANNGIVKATALTESWDKMQDRRKEFYGELHKDVAAARTLGVNDKQIRMRLQAAHISRADIWAVMSGKIPRYIPGPSARKIAHDKQPERLKVLRLLMDKQSK
jgi:DNA-directed RNA polymerase specialized sigma24 family protein